MWIYFQSTGLLINTDGSVPEGYKGYSGFGIGRDNPALEDVHEVGPIPRGNWIIGPAQDLTGTLGPMALPLKPAPGNGARGRSGFWMHGDSKSHPGLASHGCPVFAMDARQYVAGHGDVNLEVRA